MEDNGRNEACYIAATCRYSSKMKNDDNFGCRGAQDMRSVIDLWTNIGQFVKRCKESTFKTQQLCMNDFIYIISIYMETIVNL